MGDVRRFGTQRATEIEPLVFTIGPAGEESPEVTVYQPDSGVMMAIARTGTDIERALSLLLGSDYAVIKPYLDPLPPEAPSEILEAIGTHFHLERFMNSEGNRAERRRAKGRG
ncbi:hypothetical protein GCM10027047_01690 [Rhodococcus aerolatus]